MQICLSHVWGSICDDLWDHSDALVVCRQLGYTDTDSIAFRKAHYGRGVAAIHLDDVSCVGMERTLLECTHAGVHVHNCDTSEDAGVLCIGELLLEIPTIMMVEAS